MKAIPYALDNENSRTTTPVIEAFLTLPSGKLLAKSGPVVNTAQLFLALQNFSNVGPGDSNVNLQVMGANILNGIDLAYTALDYSRALAAQAVYKGWAPSDGYIAGTDNLSVVLRSASAVLMSAYCTEAADLSEVLGYVDSQRPTYIVLRLDGGLPWTVVVRQNFKTSEALADKVTALASHLGWSGAPAPVVAAVNLRAPSLPLSYER